MNTDISPANVTDYAEIADLWYRSWLSTGAENGDGVTVDVLIQRLHDEPWEMWTARSEGTVTAFLAIDRADTCLSQLFAAPEFQNCGIGSRLLEFAKQEMPGGFWLRTDEGNGGARRFYDRSGMVLDRLSEGRAYYRWQP